MFDPVSRGRAETRRRTGKNGARKGAEAQRFIASGGAAFNSDLTANGLTAKLDFSAPLRLCARIFSLLLHVSALSRETIQGYR